MGASLLNPEGSEEDFEIESFFEGRPSRSWRSRQYRKVITGSLVAIAGVVLCCLGTSVLSQARAGTALLRGGDPVALDEDEQCHTASVGESCREDVEWAMQIGITSHPDWYSDTCPRLKPSASFEEFQACVFKINRTTCPLPCNPEKKVSQEAIDHTHHEAPHHRLPEQSDPCHIARKGEQCFDRVLEAMVTGMKDHPRKYVGLSANSTFEEFQMFLHRDPGTSSCPKPCKCHTAVKGEKCYGHVKWALDEGIDAHPTWYRGLTANSTFEEVQAFLHKDSRGTCSLPCNPDVSGRIAATVSGAKEHAEVTHERRRRAHDWTRSRSNYSHSTSDQMCHTVSENQSCYKEVVWGMQHGLHKHPEWYPGLSDKSTFEDFQGVLHANPDLKCPEPCPCRTAVPGEACYDNVKWVLREGIARHPSWYGGLTQHSRVEEVQARLHEDENTTCHVPCTPPVWGKPSLFCLAVFRSTGYELGLVRSQVEKGVGIFKCDEFAVLSDKELHVTENIRTLIIPPCEKVGVSKDGTAANTLIFMQAWSVIYKEGRWRAHDWIIKADPDAVVLADRLRKHLAPHTGRNVWITNCMKYTGPGWPMMFGSLEAFSYQAMETYYEGAQRCKNNLQWQAWGEDLFMGNCLSMLGSTSVFDGGLIGDNVCKGANCADGTTAAYHPFKSTEAWFQCYNQAVR